MKKCGDWQKSLSYCDVRQAAPAAADKSTVISQAGRWEPIPAGMTSPSRSLAGAGKIPA